MRKSNFGLRIANRGLNYDEEEQSRIADCESRIELR